MATDRAGRETARERLVRMVEPPSVDGGWVPEPPVLPSPVDPQGVLPLRVLAPEADDEGRALRRRALDSALTAYTAAHGHPLDHPAPAGAPVQRRWATRTRVVVAAAIVLAATTGVVVARTSGQLHSTLVESRGIAGQVDRADTPAGAVPSAAGPPGSEDERAEDAPRSESGGDTTGGEVVVHVVGQVGEPGVVHLDAGARVADAIEAAGGATAEADLPSLNLARVLTDGEQVLVPRPGEQATGPAAGASGGTGVAAAGGLLDLNAADVTALDGLPRIGPVLAQRIVDWRTEHGRFTAVDELAEVTGIGPSVLADLRDLVRV